MHTHTYGMRPHCTAHSAWSRQPQHSRSRRSMHESKCGTFAAARLHRRTIWNTQRQSCWSIHPHNFAATLNIDGFGLLSFFSDIYIYIQQTKNGMDVHVSQKRDSEHRNGKKCNQQQHQMLAMHTYGTPPDCTPRPSLLRM